ncbi:type IV pilus biogenesis protein PilM [Salmonella enterica subsp. enterica serovar 4,[5],12:b:-]|nr:type IV pilus biogenesis protein PilM [Salmonella enterica subsp. enterica serovar 4,[5],12:b:-]
MGWFFSLLLIFLSTGSYYLTDNNNKTIQRMKLLPARQEATEFIHYANVINDYLYKYPDKRSSGGTLTSEQIGITPVYDIHNIIYGKRVYIWSADTEGLMAALQKQTKSSAMLGKVKEQKLIDNQGDDMGVPVPSAIPENAIVLIN